MGKFKYWRMMGALFALILGLHTGVEGSQVRPLGLVNLVSQSGRIFVGTVVDIQGEIGKSGLPETVYRFQVQKSLRGANRSTEDVHFFGERSTTGVRLPVAGMPTFAMGDEVLLFLRPTSERGLTSPVGMSFGVLPLSKSPSGIAYLSLHPMLLQSSQGLSTSERQKLGTGEVPLTSFLGVIEDLIEREGQL